MSEPLETPRQLMTREEYYRWSETRPAGRYELVSGEVVAMAPERGIHLRTKARAWQALDRAIATAGFDCEALPDGATVEVGEASAYEPDVTVTCGQAMADDATAAPNPVIVVEVLSPGTRSVDTGLKFAEYFRVPSIHHYLILRPDTRSVVHHRRMPDGRIESAILGEGSLRLDPPGLVVEVADLFRR